MERLKESRRDKMIYKNRTTVNNTGRAIIRTTTPQL